MVTVFKNYTLWQKVEIETQVDALIRQPDNNHLYALISFYEKAQLDYVFDYMMQKQVNNAELFYRIALPLLKLNKTDESVNFLLESTRICPNNVNYLQVLAGTYFKLENIDEVLNCYLQIRKLTPNDPFLLNNIGAILQRQEKYTEASEYFSEAIKFSPDNPFFHANLASTLEQIEEYEQAYNNMLEAIKLDPDNESFYSRVGTIVARRGNYKEALEYFLKALDSHPESPELHFNLGIIYSKLREYRLSAANYRKAIGINKEFVAAHYNLATLLLTVGSFNEGWQEYEWRIRRNINDYYQIIPRYWNGEDLKEESLYVYAEQGLGDTIQFCRYLPLLREKAKEIIFICQEDLIRLLKNTYSFARFLPFNEVNNEINPEQDRHVFLLSLPKIFNTDLNNIPAVKGPYIKISDELKNKWAKKIKLINGFKIGFVWEPKTESETHKLRSVPLEDFYNLSKIERVVLINLQKGGPEKQLNNLPANKKIINFTNEIKDFADTAAIIKNLDLVISIDSSVAHLAGAIGKQVWVILPYNSDWRWLLERNNSPWYPTMKLFRQEEPDNWDSVFAKIEKELKNNTRSARPLFSDKRIN